jgi:hypothetical protein
LVVGRVGTGGGAGLVKRTSRRSAATTASSTPWALRGGPDSDVFPAGAGGFLNGEPPAAGASFNADSLDDGSLNALRMAVFISPSDSESWVASGWSVGRLMTVLPQKRRGGADSVK